MADSLVIDSTIEIFGGPTGVPSTDPRCAGAVFQIQDGYDWGAPQPQSNIIASLLLDGERPTGTRSSNRTFVLPILITAPDRPTLAAAREVLLSTVDQESWSLTWLRDDGLPTVYDALRASASQISYNNKADKAAIGTVTITFQALPYAHSSTPEQLAFAGVISGGPPAPPSPVTLDEFDSVSGTFWTLSSNAISGSHSAKWTPSDFSAAPAASYSSTFTAKNITGRPTLKHWVGFGSSESTTTTYTRIIHGHVSTYTTTATCQSLWPSGTVTLAYVIGDSHGNTASFGTAINVTQSANTNAPNWYQVTVAIPQSTSVDMTSITSMQVTISNDGGSSLDYTNAYLDGSIAVATTSAQTVVSSRGQIYTLAGVKGTAHTPLSLQLAQSSGAAFSTCLVHRPSEDSPSAFCPQVAVANPASDVPNGGTQYTVPALTTGVNARFGGTYSVVLANLSWNSSGSPRTVTITVRQFEYSGGPSASQTTSRTFTPASDVINGLFVVGEITLPVNDIPDDNTAAFFTVSITDTNTSDRFYDIIFLDTMGQTVLINGSAYNKYYIDTPDATRDMGRVLGSTTDRSRATSVLASSLVSGGPLTVDPGTNQILCYSLQGAPSLVATYYPAWWIDRLN